MQEQKNEGNIKEIEVNFRKLKKKKKKYFWKNSYRQFLENQFSWSGSHLHLKGVKKPLCFDIKTYVFENRQTVSI